MICPRCEKDNGQGAVFCFNCGTRLVGADEGDGIGPAHIEAGEPGEVGTSASTSDTQSSEGNAPREDGPQANQGPTSGAGAATRVRKPIAIIAAAAAAVIIAIFVLYGMSGAGALGQTDGTFKAAFETSNIVRKGIAHNDYVDETPYSITSFECTDIKKTSDYEVAAHMKAVIENESFKTEITALATYVDGTKLPSDYSWAAGFVDGYSFDVTSTTTTPKKGIDRDDTNIARAFEASLSDDGTTCTATVRETEQTWFADAQFTTVYSYRFKDNRWTYVGADTTSVYDYHDIEGTYQQRGRSDMTFTVRDLNPEKGSFVVDYSASESDFVFNYSVTGTLNVDIIATAKQDYKTKAMQGVYELAGVGTSSGGDGQASLRGELKVADSGEAALKVVELSLNYSTSSGHSSRHSKWGMLFKQ